MSDVLLALPETTRITLVGRLPLVGAGSIAGLTLPRFMTQIVGRAPEAVDDRSDCDRGIEEAETVSVEFVRPDGHLRTSAAKERDRESCTRA